MAQKCNKPVTLFRCDKQLLKLGDMACAEKLRVMHFFLAPFELVLAEGLSANGRFFMSTSRVK